MKPIIVSIPGEKSPQKPKEPVLWNGCKYYKGEDKCPFTEDDEIPSMTVDYAPKNTRAFWWAAERYLYDRKLTPIREWIECFVYKHLEGCPISEEKMLESYENGTPVDYGV